MSKDPLHDNRRRVKIRGPGKDDLRLSDLLSSQLSFSPEVQRSK